MKADLGAVKLSGCHCRRGTRAGVPSPREGDRFGERAAGGLNGEGFRKGKVEGAGIGGRESREVPWGAKKGPRCKKKADGEEQTA